MSAARVLRVGLWGPVPPPLGGIGVWTLRYLAGAAAAGLDVSLIDTSPKGHQISERSAFRVGRLHLAARSLWHLGGLLRRRRPDVVHLTTSLFWATAREAAALALCRRARVPTVLHIHASSQIIQWREGLGRPQRLLLDATLQSADCLLVLSRELEAYLREVLPRQRIARIGNMVDLAPPGTPVLPPRQRLRVLFVGACTPLKGLTELADAMLGLPDAELIVVGDPGEAMDPQRGAALTEALARLRATGRLTTAGELPPERTGQIYREVDVFALPSHREGLPTVLLEAMAADLPCVVTGVGAIPEVIAGGLALQVPVADVGALRTALARLLGDASLRASLGSQAGFSVRARYGVAAIMAQYRALYGDVCGPR